MMAFAVAVPLALIAAMLVYRQLSRAATGPGRIGSTKIVVAAGALPPGTQLGTDNVRQIDWPAAKPMEGMFSRVEDCAGRVVVTPVRENAPILEGNLAPKDSGAGLSAIIPPGLRAVSVAVNDVVGVAGFVQPGTTVDVLATGAVQGQGTSLTRTILENIRVLAAGQKVQPDKDGAPQTVSVVTLLVNPDQANVLTLASTQGRIQLALRNFVDTKQVDVLPAELNEVFGGARPVAVHVARPSTRPASAEPSPRPYEIEVIRGDKPEVRVIPQQ